MLPYLTRRILIALPILFGVTVLTFFIAHLMPGSYIDTLVSIDTTFGPRQNPSPELAKYYGLDRSLPEQYLIWLRELGRGNFGVSYTTGQPVLGEISKRLPATLALTVSAILIAISGGAVLGILSALKQYSWLDQLLTFLGLVWISTPSFVLGLLSLYFFYLVIPLFPLGGDAPIGEKYGLTTRIHHLILPALVMGLGTLAEFMRYTRSSILEVIAQDYITMARAKGLFERLVVLRHAVPNALIPMITIIGLHLPGLLSSAFIVETIFAWPGLGRLGVLAVNRRDYPVIMTLNLIVAVAVLAANLVTDVVYSLVDPRVRHE